MSALEILRELRVTQEKIADAKVRYAFARGGAKRGLFDLIYDLQKELHRIEDDADKLLGITQFERAEK